MNPESASAGVPGALLVGASAGAHRLQVRSTSRATIARLRKGVITALVAAGLAVLVPDMRGQAQTTNPLPYSGGILVTGNYVVGGVDLTENANPIDANGFSTGTIAMSGVPADADILAAYLFWEAITVASNPSQAAGVKFRGVDVDIDDPLVVKRTSQDLTGSTASCWSSGTPLAMHEFRANVLPLLPLRVDKNGEATGKRIVNNADLVANGFPLHTVKLPVRSGNNLPESAGATLVVVYRDPNPDRAQNPLRKVVMYDGLYIQPGINVAMEQTLQGFYKAAATKSARLTQIVGSGQPNSNDKIAFNGGPIASDPFLGGSASQRGWSNVTYDVSSLMSATTNSPVYGETATTKVFHQPGNGGNDCLAWGAIIFSTTVADQDRDGLPDGLEDSVSGLKDPDGTDLPNLKAMGAGSDQKDFFDEINAMRADPGTKYGSTSAPFSPTTPTITDTAGHHHVPTPEVLKMVGDRYASHGIRPHFDVGDVGAFHALGVVPRPDADWEHDDDYTATVADQYLVGNGVGSNVASLARGGEIIKETACDSGSPGCHFPDYPGTVFWRFGLLFLRDMPVTDDGAELTIDQLTDPTKPDYYDWTASTHTQRTRFNHARANLFHYTLNAHARGTPKSLPCLVDGEPAPYDGEEGQACGTVDPNFTANPDFQALEYHVPSSASGIADLPGGDTLITLGLWDEFVGKPFARAGTWFHELGHNLSLWHSGGAAVWGNKGSNTANYVEPNCKPNYLSSMSYLFQVHGLFNAADQIQLDYSTAQHAALDETGTLNDMPLSPTAAYIPSWFAPAGSALATSQAATAATRYCSGDKFNAASPPASMARVDAPSPSASIDWNGDGVVNATFGQDVNFDGATPGTTLTGFNDWSKVLWDQIGAQGLWPDGGTLEFEGGLLGKVWWPARQGWWSARQGWWSARQVGRTRALAGRRRTRGGWRRSARQVWWPARQVWWPARQGWWSARQIGRSGVVVRPREGNGQGATVRGHRVRHRKRCRLRWSGRVQRRLSPDSGALHAVANWQLQLPRGPAQARQRTGRGVHDR